jgi:predicted amidophosphoribosyltransferase
VTRQFPNRVSNVGNDLTQVAGSYLHSVAAGAWSACEVCTLPIDDNYTVCPQCLNHRRSGMPLADRAGFLVYADEPLSQTYRTMRGYKDPHTQATFKPIIQALLAVGLRGHFECAMRLTHEPDCGWAVVPSTRGRATFGELVRSFTTSPTLEVRMSHAGPKPDRVLNPSSWSIDSGVTLPSHMVVIDDAWASGASSQSLAVTLKQAGVSQVSILSVARVLSPNWGPNTAFFRDVLPSLPYDWTICPWTRAACPE